MTPGTMDDEGTTTMNPLARLACFALAATVSTGCQQVEQLIDAQAMPVSENGVFTDDGRFFVAGGDTIYEVVGDANGVSAEILLQDDCNFGGLVDRGNLLYTVCMATTGRPPARLFRIDPSRRGTPDVQAVEVPVDGGAVQLNGMDFGPDGSLYISNSFALLSPDPAVLRVDILSEAPLTIETETFLGASQGGLFPNGIRIDGNELYLSRGFEVVRMELLPGGNHGPIEVVYETDEAAVVDDFDVIADYLVMAQSSLAGIVGPGGLGSKLVVTDLDGNLAESVDLPFAPSSTAVRLDSLFGDEAVIVTSYFDGGLYRVRFGR